MVHLSTSDLDSEAFMSDNSANSIPYQAKEPMLNLNETVENIFSDKYSYQNMIKKLGEHYKMPLSKLRKKYIVKNCGISEMSRNRCFAKRQRKNES